MTGRQNETHETWDFITKVAPVGPCEGGMGVSSPRADGLGFRVGSRWGRCFKMAKML